MLFPIDRVDCAVENRLFVAHRRCADFGSCAHAVPRMKKLTLRVLFYIRAARWGVIIEDRVCSQGLEQVEIVWR